MLQQRVQFVHDIARSPLERAALAPAQTRAVVGAYPRETGDLRLNQRPTGGKLGCLQHRGRRPGSSGLNGNHLRPPSARVAGIYARISSGYPCRAGTSTLPAKPAAELPRHIRSLLQAYGCFTPFRRTTQRAGLRTATLRPQAKRPGGRGVYAWSGGMFTISGPLE
jgi:hypothetical protein